MSLISRTERHQFTCEKEIDSPEGDAFRGVCCGVDGARKLATAELPSCKVPFNRPLATMTARKRGR